MTQTAQPFSDSLTYEPGDDITDMVSEWLSRPALKTLVEMFDGSWPSGTVGQQLSVLIEFSAVWDRRQGASRLDIQELVEGHELGARVMDCVNELGLVSQPPLARPHYDWVLVLGGLATGCLSRVEALTQLLSSGVEVGGVALLGSFRELQEVEAASLAEEGFPSATNEAAVLMAAADRWLGLPQGSETWTVELAGDPDNEPRLASLHAWARTSIQGVGFDGEPPLIHTFASPSSDPLNRPANTADTYLTVADAMQFSSGQSLLLVTSRIYRYQWLDAVRVLGLPGGLSVEMYGTESGPQSRRDFGPSWYLQEVRSMLRSSQALLNALG